MAEPQFTLVGCAHNIDLTSDPARLDLRQLPNAGIDKICLRASQRDVIETLRHITEGQLIGVIANLPAAHSRGGRLTVTSLEILGKATPQQEVA
jgi:hypothetical protein